MLRMVPLPVPGRIYQLTSARRDEHRLDLDLAVAHDELVGAVHRAHLPRIEADIAVGPFARDRHGGGAGGGRARDRLGEHPLEQCADRGLALDGLAFLQHDRIVGIVRHHRIDIRFGDGGIVPGDDLGRGKRRRQCRTRNRAGRERHDIIFQHAVIPSWFVSPLAAGQMRGQRFVGHNRQIG
jgi:hypothetical protein